jgi:acyl carrier protein
MTDLVEEKVKALIAEAAPRRFKKTRITPQTLLQKELGLDSIGILSMMFRFEETFGIDLRNLDVNINLAKLRTVEDVVRAAREILSRTAKAPA